jgi:hypothetical protein
MRRSQHHSTARSSGQGMTLSKTLAPEDLRRGQFVTLLNEIYEFPSFFWCDGTWSLAPEAPVRLQLLATDAGVPLKVKHVCLPFVLAKHPQGSVRTLDLRRCRLARLDAAYAKAAWRAVATSRRNH